MFRKTDGENCAVFNTDGSVELYHDNSKKFETTSTGATVTGSLIVSSNVDIGNETSGRKTLTINSSDNGAALLFRADAATRAVIEVPDGETALVFGVEVSNTPAERLRIETTGTTVTGDLTVSATSNLKQITETVANAFNTSLAPSTGTLTVDTSVGTVVLGDLSASVTTWAFTNVPTANSKATTITLIIDGDTAQTYGDACNVNGSAVSGGVKWAGGSAPTATNNFDIITFTIVKDSAGTINVFGSGNTDFS